MINTTSDNSSDQINPPQDLTGYAYYSIGLSLALLLLIFFITLLSFYCNRRNNSPSGQEDHSSGLNLQTTMERGGSSLPTTQVDEEAILKSYPVVLYSQIAKLDVHGKEGGAADSSGTCFSSCCSICLADYKDSEWLRLLPDCGHFFHRKCIDLWFRMNPSCPLCRTSPLPTPLSTPLAEVDPLANTRS